MEQYEVEIVQGNNRGVYDIRAEWDGQFCVDGEIARISGFEFDELTLEVVYTVTLEGAMTADDRQDYDDWYFRVLSVSVD